MKATSNKVGMEPIPGYVLRKRLGAGGYGEVWLADAPGGLQKAVKLIHGTVDQSQASSELKSLERIRQVNHPFLLSLERIEVVDDQVVIVTELADGSLFEKFDYYRRKGHPGIPRTELLEYLRDTAEGLDYLAQKHALAHLDVKPGNLLLIAERVKVADFGLVKNLQETNQSLVSGLTPTYSGPEIFDGRPDYRSDQYSLAIVFMELLTGTYPFNGSTTGELARQHISQPPNLEALPPSDRPIIARALSKNPMDRYASCRQMVDQLAKQKATALPEAKAAGPEEKTITSEISLSQSTDNTIKPQHEYLPALDQQATVDTVTPRCVFVGVGGMGVQSLSRLYARLEGDCDAELSVEDHGWLAIDTAGAELQQLVDSGVPRGKAVQLPIFQPSEYRDSEPELFVPLSRRWLYNIPKSRTTEGVRPIAILSLLDHYEHLKSKVRNELTPVVKAHREDEFTNQPLRVYLMASSHGGTGGGLIAELAFLIRFVMRELSFNDYRLCANMTLATTSNPTTASLPAAASLACLSEFSHFMSELEVHPTLFFQDRAVGNLGKPVDWVTLVDGGLHGSQKEEAAAVEQLSTLVYVDSQTEISTLLSEERIKGEGDMDWLRFAKAHELELVGNIDPQLLNRNCVKQVLDRATVYLGASAKTSVAANDSATYSGELPLTQEAIVQISQRFLQGLAISMNGQEESSSLRGGQEKIAAWNRRLSTNGDIVRKQMIADCDKWHTAVKSIVKTRLYNWRQVNQIQLNIIESIVEYSETSTQTLYDTLRSCEGGETQQLDTSDPTLPKRIGLYLRNLSEKYLMYLSNFRTGGIELRRRLMGWRDSLVAETELHGRHNWDGNVSTLPSQLQILVGRVTAELETMLLEDNMEVLELARAMVLEGETVPATRSLSNLLEQATELFHRIANQFMVTTEMLTNTVDDNSKKPLAEFGNMRPSVAQFGGNFHRFLISSPEQVSGVKRMLRDHQLTKTTSVVQGRSNMAAFAYFDGNQYGLSQVLATAFRPAPGTLQLAERLRTRIDVEWEPVDSLFEKAVNQSEAQPIIAPQPSGMPHGPQTNV